MQSPNFLICEIASIHLKEHSLLENLQYTYHTKSFIQYKTTREPSQALPWTQSSTCHSPKIHRAIYSLICPSCVLCLVFIMPCIGSNGLYTVSSLCKFPCVSTALLPFAYGHVYFVVLEHLKVGSTFAYGHGRGDDAKTLAELGFQVCTNAVSCYFRLCFWSVDKVLIYATSFCRLAIT